MSETEKKQIEFNIKTHNRVSSKYDKTHSEIFSKKEQKRIREKLEFASSLIKTKKNKKALDFGCGSGNLTNHLIKLKFDVTCCDVTPKFLELVKRKFENKVQTIRLNGIDLSNIKDNSYDLIATYSVLHHVPNYLKAVEEMMRVLKPGGVLYIDHEVAPSYWKPSKELKEFRKKVKLPFMLNNFKTYFSYSTFKTFTIQRFNPRYRPEGDIHVFKDDHIEWDKVKKVIKKNKGDKIIEEDHLLYKKGYPKKIYEQYKDKCTDYRVLIAVKRK